MYLDKPKSPSFTQSGLATRMFLTAISLNPQKQKKLRCANTLCTNKLHVFFLQYMSAWITVKVRFLEQPIGNTQDNVKEPI